MEDRSILEGKTLKDLRYYQNAGINKYKLVQKTELISLIVDQAQSI